MQNTAEYPERVDLSASSGRMWALMEKLFPIYRSLCGPGYQASMDAIAARYPLNFIDVPSGAKAYDWTVPNEFAVREAYLIGPDGKKYLDFHENSYHLWIYSQPFDGEVDYEELREHLTDCPELPSAVRMKPTYYRPLWGFCASDAELAAMPKSGKYRVKIDVSHDPGVLRMGEMYLPGETESEVMLTSYLCHPRGANDNLSGVAVACELMRLLAELPGRRFSYRMVIWPETIGSISYIHKYRERMKNVVGGYVILCVGAGDEYVYKRSFRAQTDIDRAAMHALAHSGAAYRDIPYDQAQGSDERQFNMVGLRLPFGCIMRARPGYFPEYHTSADDLTFVRPECLEESLRIHLDAVLALERNLTYRCRSVVEPFLTAHGIYPFQYGSGMGRLGSQYGQAYYYLMGADGERDLLRVADDAGLPIRVFDPAVRDFLRVGLLERA